MTTAAAGPLPAPLRLAFLGDMGFTWRLADSIEQHGVDWFAAGIGDALRHHDAVIGNLECAVVSPDSAPPAPGRICTRPVALRALQALGVDTVTLANNHVTDGGPQGVASSLQLLADHDLRTFGAGLNREAAEAPLIIAADGRRVALFGVCDAPYAYAGADHAGVAPLDPRRLCRRVARQRARGDVVVVVLHAGTEFVFHPEPARVRLARQLVDAGASLVIQHHPHVVQGVERHGDGLIAYSLGNFIFRLSDNNYQKSINGVHDGYILSVTLSAADPHRVEDFAVLPTRIDALDRPALLSGAAAANAQAHIDGLSQDLADARRRRQHYRAVCRREVRKGLLDSYYSLRHRGPAAALSRLGTELGRRDRQRYYLGLLGLNRL